MTRAIGHPKLESCFKIKGVRGKRTHRKLRTQEERKGKKVERV